MRNCAAPSRRSPRRWCFAIRRIPPAKSSRARSCFHLLDLAREHDAFIITDEVYEHIVYAPHEHVPFSTLPGAWERTLACGSLSKTYSITGWRLGYVLADAAIIAQARKVHDFLTVGAAAPLQEAAVTALEFPPDYYAELQAEYTRKRELFLGYLRQTGLPFTTPQGAYYTLLDISSLGYANDRTAAEELTRNLGVTGVPGLQLLPRAGPSLHPFPFRQEGGDVASRGERLAAKLGR